MAYARTRKHYRAARKEAETTPKNGCFVTNSQKKKGIIALSIVILAVFIKGFLFGYIAGRNHA